MTDIYFVFKRSDGYVGSICSSSRAAAENVLRSYTSNGFEWSNEILFETEHWGKAYNFIANERAFDPDYIAWSRSS